MRVAAIALVVCACGKPAAPPPENTVTPERTASPARISNDAPLPLIELLHAVPTTITVSSRVQNASISPEQLVDHDLQTAWNSKTGDLVGAWIDIELPSQAVIYSVRLTAGHTGTGPKGEDWFTMNVRIKQVTVLRGDQLLKTFTLDVADRKLQNLELPSLSIGSKLRIRVDAIAVGSKRAWREVCISELEVWGTVPFALVHPETPKVIVAVPAAPQASIAEDPCNEFTADHEAYAARDAELNKQVSECLKAGITCEAPDEPHCDVTPTEIPKPSGPWRHAGVRCHGRGGPDPYSSCQLVFETSLGWWLGPPPDTDAARSGLVIVDTKVRDVIPGGEPELIVRYWVDDGRPREDLLTVCATNGACINPVQTSGPGWEVRPRFDQGDLILEPLKGKPPPDVLGRSAIQL